VSNPQKLQQAVIQRLMTVIDPETNLDVVRMRLVQDLTVETGGKVTYIFRPTSPLCPIAVPLALSILQAEKTIAGQATTTAYTYNEDNQLVTAQAGSGTLWHYRFDGNGSLVETTPGAQPGNGAIRYTYNSAGQLVQVEAHYGTGYQVQAEMVYNGMRQRLALTAQHAGQSLSTAYLLDGQTLLAATADEATTFYLPGIGEHKQGWSYYLADGTNSVRQLSSPTGQVSVTRSFTPWGELLELSG
jgi:YD repeat-containing protein